MCWPTEYRFLICIKGWSENSFLLALTDYRIRRNPQDHATASGITAELNESQPLSTIIKLMIIAPYRGPLLYPPSSCLVSFIDFNASQRLSSGHAFSELLSLCIFGKRVHSKSLASFTSHHRGVQSFWRIWGPDLTPSIQVMWGLSLSSLKMQLFQLSINTGVAISCSTHSVNLPFFFFFFF